MSFKTLAECEVSSIDHPTKNRYREINLESLNNTFFPLKDLTEQFSDSPDINRKMTTLCFTGYFLEPKLYSASS